MSAATKNGRAAKRLRKELVDALPPLEPPALLKLDLGCGMNKREGFLGVDAIAFPGVDVVCNLTEREPSLVSDGLMHHVDPIGRFKPWPWPDNSVAEAHSSHFVEHLTNLGGAWERVHFFNELYRVLVPGGKATIIVPYWCSNRYYGDPTHKEPIGEMAFYYLKREWRLGNPALGIPAGAPHDDVSYNPKMYSCDFEAVWGYSLHPQLTTRNAEAQQFAILWYKEACQDLIATLTKRA